MENKNKKVELFYMYMKELYKKEWTLVSARALKDNADKKEELNKQIYAVQEQEQTAISMFYLFIGNLPNDRLLVDIYDDAFSDVEKGDYYVLQ